MNIVTRTDAAGAQWGAAFSDCELYRYRLWRTWDASRPAIAFCMLNPSTADEVRNDPTIERCMRRAVAWGYGGLYIINIFALRSTDPAALYDVDDPVGRDNDAAIADCLLSCAAVVCGWGTHGALRSRGPSVHAMMRSQCPGKVLALKINKDGSPAHPLYLPYRLLPQEWV